LVVRGETKGPKMSEITFCKLENRGIIAVSGADSRSFLQGLISNDIEKVSDTTSIYSTFLSPQGKYLFDFFISQSGEDLLIDCEKDRLPDFMKRLRLYKLRADVEVVDRSDDFQVVAIWGDAAIEETGLPLDAGAAKPLPGGTLSVDPRLVDAGLRAVLPAGPTAIDGVSMDEVNFADYDAHRLSLGLPDSSRDLIVDKSTLLECGVDDLNGIDWKKGCYMGQEVTARSKYRGLVKKRLVPIDIDGPAPEAGTLIMAGDKQAGEMRSSAGNKGLALMRLEYLDGDSALISADESSTTLTPRKPGWADF